MRLIGVFGLVLVALAGCVGTRAPQPAAVVPVFVPAGQRPDAGTALAMFRQVAARLEPVAEAMCRAQGRSAVCDYRIVIDDRPGQPANAFQSLEAGGRPRLTVTVALIEDMRNADEIAFVLGHEAAHHLAGHIPQTEQSAMAGALLAGVLASAGGMGADGVDLAQRLGATVGARSFSKEFELEADALGAEIAWRAGYDPRRGAGYFDRIADPGNRFLGSHPANARRKAVVAQTVATLGG